MTWTRGQRIPVAELGVTDELTLGLGTVPSGFGVVVAGLDDDDSLVARGFLLSRHQPSSFEGSVAMCGGRYVSARSRDALGAAIEAWRTTPAFTVIEVPVDREASRALHARLVEYACRTPSGDERGQAEAR